jgi:hypothetical protein
VTFQGDVLAVEGHLLKPGGGTLEIRASADACSMIRFYRITLDSVHEGSLGARAGGRNLHRREPQGKYRKIHFLEEFENGCGVLT